LVLHGFIFSAFHTAIMRITVENCYIGTITFEFPQQTNMQLKLESLNYRSMKASWS